MIIIQQIKAARALLDWSQGVLGDKAGLSQTAIAGIESGRTRPTLKTLDAIRLVFENAGVQFTEDGVRFFSPTIKILREPDFEQQMQEFFYTTCLHQSVQDLLFFCINPSLLAPPQRETVLRNIERLKDLGLQTRAIVSDKSRVADLLLDLSSYKAIPDQYVAGTNPFFVFGDYVGNIMYDTHEVCLIRNLPLATTYRKLFEFIWDKGSELRGV